MYIKTLAASMLAAAGIASAAPFESRQATPECPVVKTGDYVWQISKFYARKPEGVKINSISFNVKATNGGTADFTCSAQADVVEDGKFYQCGENSFIWFAFQNDRSGLILQQSVSDDIQYVATATIPNYCRAGGNGPTDFVCQGVADAFVTLVQYPGLARPE